MTFSFMVQFKLEDLKGKFLSSKVSIFKIIRQFLWSFCEKSILGHKENLGLRPRDFHDNNT